MCTVKAMVPVKKLVKDIVAHNSRGHQTVEKSELVGIKMADEI